MYNLPARIVEVTIDELGVFLRWQDSKGHRMVWTMATTGDDREISSSYVDAVNRLYVSCLRGDA